MKRIMMVVLMVGLVGCFPTTVSVAPDGRIALVREEGVFVFDLAKQQARLIAKPRGEEKAVWVQFSSDSEWLLFVIAKENGPGTIYVVKSSGGQPKEVYKGEDPMVWARWSPDGKYISVGEVSPESKDDLGNLVNIKVVSMVTGKVADLAFDTAQIHAWTPDSKAIVAIVVKRKIADEIMGGTLTRFGLDGKAASLAELVAQQDLSLDISSDGREVLVTALGAWEAGTKTGMSKELKYNALFVCALDGKTAPKQIAKAPAACAFFSPDGKHLLCVRLAEGDQDMGGAPAARLTVLDRDGKKEKTLAKGVLNKEEGFNSTRYLPVWVSNDTVIFWKKLVVVGPGGEAVTTMSVKLDGAAPVNLQPQIETLVEKAK